MRPCPGSVQLTGLRLPDSTRTLKDDNELLHWTQITTLEALVGVTGSLLHEQQEEDGAPLFEAVYETYVDLVDASTAGAKSRSTGTSDTSFRDRRRQLIPRAEALLVDAYRRLQGQGLDGGPGAAAPSLEAALAHGHRAYPEKQGQAKVSKAASRKRGRSSSTATAPPPLPSPSSAAALVLDPSPGGEAREQEDGRPASPVAEEGVSPPLSAAADDAGEEEESSHAGGDNKRQRVVEEEEEEVQQLAGLGADQDGDEDDDEGFIHPEGVIHVDDIAVDDED